MNIKDFAARAGVSTATVSRAFHEPGKLRPDTRSHVLRLAESLGYFPDASGRALVRGKHDTLGLVWPIEVEGAESLYAQRILAFLTQRLVQEDLDLLVCPIDRRDPATLLHAKRTWRRARCDAWIVLYPRPNDLFVHSLAQGNKPVVCLVGDVPGYPHWRSVRLDQAQWIGDALQRLRQSGSRRVLFLSGRLDEPDHDERRDAFASLAPGLFPAGAFILPAGDREDFIRHVRDKRCDAVVAVDDRTALLALEWCRQEKISVPSQVRLVGIDDAPAAASSSPPLSTYRQPLREMISWAVDLALGRKTRSRSFRAEFVPRASLPAQDKD